MSVEVVRRSPKPAPDEVLRAWAKAWFEEGRKVTSDELPKRRGFERLPRRWVAQRTFTWLALNRRMSKDYERSCSTGEAFFFVAMTRLMARRLARS